MSAVSPLDARTARRRVPRLARIAPPAWLLTAAFGVAYVIVAPISSDLAAAGYRSELISRAGFTLWDNGWYAGHHLLAYSVLAPALGALIGPQPLAAAAAVLATALFGALVTEHCSRRAARVATLWFALGASATLLANRIPFELGLALALAALVAARRAARPPASTRRLASAARGAGLARRGGREPRRALWLGAALVLAALGALASPLAGAFLALAALAWAVAGWARAVALALAAAALALVALLELAFPEGGTQPFVASAFYPALAAVLVLAAVLPAHERVLRTGAVLYALAMVGAYAIPSAVGGNADRLGSLFAGPLLACALVGGRTAYGEGSVARRVSRRRRPVWPRLGSASRRTWALLAFASLLLYWQLQAPISNYVAAAGDAAAKRSFYTPLLAELRRLGVGYGARPTRVEVVPTRDHAEARWVAARVSIARGWERQLDTLRDGIFYAHPRSGLSAASYEAWLRANAVSYVALPDAPLDYSSLAEERLVRAAPRYLSEVWRSPRWRLFAVVAPAPLAQPPSVLIGLGADSFTLRAPRAGSYVVRVRFTRYWALAAGRGCVSRAPGDWTAVQTRAAGAVRVAIDFSLSRVFEDGRRCR